VIVDRRDFGERRGSFVEGDRVYLHRPSFDRPTEGKSGVDIERARRSGIDRREPRREERQGVTPQRERRPPEFRTPGKGQFSGPDLQSGRGRELRGRSEPSRERGIPARPERRKEVKDISDSVNPLVEQGKGGD